MAQPGWPRTPGRKVVARQAVGRTVSKQMVWGVWEGWIPPSLGYVVALAG